MPAPRTSRGGDAETVAGSDGPEALNAGFERVQPEAHPSRGNGSHSSRFARADHAKTAEGRKVRILQDSNLRRQSLFDF